MKSVLPFLFLIFPAVALASNKLECELRSEVFPDAFQDIQYIEDDGADATSVIINRGLVSIARVKSVALSEMTIGTVTVAECRETFDPSAKVQAHTLTCKTHDFGTCTLA